jgi:hypothetical protein
MAALTLLVRDRVRTDECMAAFSSFTSREQRLIQSEAVASFTLSLL